MSVVLAGYLLDRAKHELLTAIAPVKQSHNVRIGEKGAIKSASDMRQTTAERISATKGGSPGFDFFLPRVLVSFSSALCVSVCIKALA